MARQDDVLTAEASPDEPSVRREALLPVPVGVAWLGLALSLFLLWEHLHAASGLCAADSGCRQVLDSRFAAVGRVPLAAMGALCYGFLLLGLLLAFGAADGALRRGLLRVTGWLALAATVASLLLLYVQLGVLRAFCPLCTASLVVVAALYVLLGRVPRRGPRRARSAKAALLGMGLVLLTLLGAAGVVLGSRSDVVARFDGQEITKDTLSREMALTLYDLDRRTYDAERDWLDWKIGNRVLAAEARRRGITMDRLLAEEVEAGLDVSAGEVDRWVAARRSVPEEELRERGHQVLLVEKRQARRRALIDSLRGRHDVEILLHPPVLPRVEIDTTDAQRRGPADARVAFVVFSEFQCPHCARLAEALEHVRKRHVEDVSITFLHYPLDGEPASEAAASAAEAAGLQGRFWEFHDRLFRTPDTPDEAALVAQADALGLDRAAFDSDRKGERTRAIVAAHRRQAEELGIRRVPALFLDRRYVGGALEETDLERLVVETLESPWASLLPAGR